MQRYIDKNSMLSHAGQHMPLNNWAQKTGLTVETILARLNHFSWTVEDCLSKRPGGKRPNNDEYFMRIASQVALRGTCARRVVGCVIVDVHNNIMSTGYNSVASGLPHCAQKPCAGAGAKSGTDLHLCEARHAEDVALMKCPNINAIHTVYSTTEPCAGCTRRLLDTSCKRVVFAEPYPGSDSRAIWKGAGREWYEMPIIITSS